MSQDPQYDQVRALIAWHFKVEPGLQRVFVLPPTPNGEQHEVVRLLEVNALAPATGSLDPFSFAATKDLPFRTVVAEITPEEFERMQRDPGAIRGADAWDLASAAEFARPSEP